jgi:hypothetical protein
MFFKDAGLSVGLTTQTLKKILLRKLQRNTEEKHGRSQDPHMVVAPVGKKKKTLIMYLF